MDSYLAVKDLLNVNINELWVTKKKNYASTFAVRNAFMESKFTLLGKIYM